MNNSNKIIIITAPSGSGKTTITTYLMQHFLQLTFSVSATTRQPRGTEKDGVDYHFLTEEQFKQNIQQDKFVEWEMVYQGKYYGTLKNELEKIWAQHKIPVLDIDVKGAIHVQQQCSASLTIFIQPPSIEELEKRLQSRGTENETSIAARINKASYELSFKNNFDKIIINQDLQKAQIEAAQIINAYLES